MVACHEGKARVVERLVESEASVNMQSEVSIIILACQECCTAEDSSCTCHSSFHLLVYVHKLHKITTTMQ